METIQTDKLFLSQRQIRIRISIRIFIVQVQVYKENVKVLQPQTHSLTLGLKASDEFLRHKNNTCHPQNVSFGKKESPSAQYLTVAMDEM